MKAMLPAALAGLSLFVLRGFGDDNPPAAASEREAVLLHEWMGAAFLGFNAQGRLLAYDSARRVFEVHDLAARNAPVTGWNLPEDGGKVFSGALSADRQTLATVSEVGRNQSRIQLWNALTGEMTGPEFAPSDVAHVAFSPDSKTLAGVVALDGTLRVWDTTSGRLRWSQALPSPMQVAWIGIQFSPDGRFVAARNSFALQIWDVAARKVAGAGDLAFFHDISPDWKLAHGFTLKPAAQPPPQSTLLDITDPNQPHAATNALPEELMASMEMAAFSPDSRFLALSLRDQTLRLWSFTERRVVHQMADAGGRVIRLLVSPDNRRLATYEVDLTQQRSTLRGSVRLWDVATGQALGAARPHPGMFWSWQFDPDCRHLVVSFAHGNDTFGTQIWQLPARANSGAESQAKVAEDSPVPVTAGGKDAFAEDAFRLCALLEAWPGSDRAETSRLLAEAFVAGLLQGHPEVPPDHRRELAIEFEPRIAMAFQNLAAAASRERFTHEEVRELIRFYETPLGRKYARAYPGWKDQIAAGDTERQKVVEALLARVRPPATADASYRPPASRIARRTYTADLRSWPASRTEHGVAAFEAAGIVVTSLEAGTP